MAPPPSHLEAPCAVFVYGTLKRGQCREGCWPCAPVEVVEGHIKAVLFDLGPYPAIRRGDGLVLGELWRFGPEQMAVVLATLDPIEDCLGRPDDEYERKVVSVETARGAVRAWTYLYVRELEPSKRVPGCPAAWGGSRRSS